MSLRKFDSKLIIRHTGTKLLLRELPGMVATRRAEEAPSETGCIQNGRRAEAIRVLDSGFGVRPVS